MRFYRYIAGARGEHLTETKNSDNFVCDTDTLLSAARQRVRFPASLRSNQIFEIYVSLMTWYGTLMCCGYLLRRNVSRFHWMPSQQSYQDLSLPRTMLTHIRLCARWKNAPFCAWLKRKTSWFMPFLHLRETHACALQGVYAYRYWKPMHLRKYSGRFRHAFSSITMYGVV